MSQAGIRTPSQGPSWTPDKTNSIHNTDAWRHLIRDYGHPDNSASQITGSQELKYRRPPTVWTHTPTDGHQLRACGLRCTRNREHNKILAVQF